MATTPGTSLASTAWFSRLSIFARACAGAPWAAARRAVAEPIDAAAATATAPFSRSRRLGDVAVIRCPFLGWRALLQQRPLCEACRTRIGERIRRNEQQQGLEMSR